MAVLRSHLALTVTDVERSLPFYARQDKIWVRDPDGTPWEVFATHEDTDEAGDGGLAACCT
jgi:hypothetical protein